MWNSMVDVDVVDQWSLMEAEVLLNLHQEARCLHSSQYHHLHHNAPEENNNNTELVLDPNITFGKSCRMWCNLGKAAFVCFSLFCLYTDYNEECKETTGKTVQYFVVKTHSDFLHLCFLLWKRKSTWVSTFKNIFTFHLWMISPLILVHMLTTTTIIMRVAKPTDTTMSLKRPGERIQT